MTAAPRIVVVGAGIIGASIAWHLAHAGQSVFVLDAAEAGGQATQHSWAWINPGWDQPVPYRQLRLQAVREWQRLAGRLPELELRWCGVLRWDRPEAELRVLAQRGGAALQVLERDAIARCEPQLVMPPALALHAGSDGVVEPFGAARLLLASARAHGARLLTHCPAVALEAQAGRMVAVRTERTRIAADLVIVAAGVGTSSLLGSLGLQLRLRHAPAILVQTPVQPRLLNGLLVTPNASIRQRPDGRLSLCDDLADDDAATLSAAAHRVVDEAARLLDLPLHAEAVHLAERPMPEDGLPAVGWVESVPGLYLAVTHSGVTLAPALGHYVAQEVLGGEREPLLRRYGPGRVLSG